MQTRRFINKHGFLVLGTPFQRDPGFTTCSEIKETTGLIESRQGGSLFASKSPGLANVEPITLTRPATVAFPDLLAWYRLVTDGAVALERRHGGGIGFGAPSEDYYKYTIDIVALDRAYGYLQMFRCYNVFPTEVTLVDGFDNNAEERAMESIILQPERVELVDCGGKSINISIFVDTPCGGYAKTFGAAKSDLNALAPGTFISGFRDIGGLK